MKMYFVVGEDSRLTEGISSSPFHLDEVCVDVPEDHEVLKFPHSYRYVNGEFIKDNEYTLDQAKIRKDRELNEECRKAISKGFYHTIDGVEYHFSYDTEAQINFGDSREILKEGMEDSVMWTVTKNGVYNRIPIDLQEMNRLSLTISQHKQGNISKYRDVLLPQVYAATTLEEVQSISWDSAPNKSEGAT